MDKEELLALFAKANGKYKDLNEAFIALKAKLDEENADTIKIKKMGYCIKLSF